MKILREDWKKYATEQIRSPRPFELTTTISAAVQFAILKFDECKKPFRLLNLGAGVRKITSETDICPKCHGTGKI